MDKVNFPANIKNLQQKGLPDTPEPYSPSARQKKLVTALWNRMEQLFRAKWTSSEGPIFDRDEQYTDNFLFWCSKTSDLSDQQWSHAFKMVEQEIVSKKRAGDDYWPPSYAEFVDMAKPRSLSPDGKHVEAYKVFEPEKQITDQGALERTISAHQKHIAAMKELRS